MSLGPNERLTPLVALINDTEAYAVRVGDEQGWNQELTSELFSKVLLIGCNWSALSELVSLRHYKSHECQLHDVIVDEYAMYTKVPCSPGSRIEQGEELFTICQLKDRYYTVIRKLTNEKIKYDMKADINRRLMLAERYQADSKTLQNEMKMKENIALLQQLARKLKANPQSNIITTLYPQVQLPPLPEPDQKKSTLIKIDEMSGLPLLGDEFKSISILRDLQPMQSLADLALSQIAAKAVLCSTLTKHIDDAVLQFYYPTATGYKTNVHHHHGKEYQEAINKVLKKAKDNPEISAGVRSAEGDTITPSQYFVTDRFTPFVHSLTCFRAYAETVDEACVVTNLHKQLRAVEQMHAQWIEKLVDVRRTVRSATKKKRP